LICLAESLLPQGQGAKQVQAEILESEWNEDGKDAFEPEETKHYPGHENTIQE
jgi:hypothetical protein